MVIASQNITVYRVKWEETVIDLLEADVFDNENAMRFSARYEINKRIRIFDAQPTFNFS